MSNVFKDKKKKDIQSVNIDNKHQEIIKTIDEQKKEITQLQKKLEEKQKKLKQIESIPNNEITDDELDLKFSLKFDIEELEKYISNNNPEKILKDYFLHTGHILFKYYNKENNSIGTYEKSSPLSKSIMDFFKKEEDKKKSDIEDKKLLTKTQLLDKYMSYVDSQYITEKDKELDIEICVKCHTQKLYIYNEGLMICKNCGAQDFVFIDCEKPSYKEPFKEISYLAYKRINHFNEHLSQFQGKECTEIPEDIYNQIHAEIKKQRITDLSLINTDKVKEILRKLNQNKYYEHATHIANHINGITPPTISKSQEETLRVMFKEAQIPFIKHCPPGRRNFLSYPYILHKFCQLLEFDELLPCFPLLKSRERLQEQDECWKKMCDDLGWQFIKSI